ncbi:hypothetical protein CRG98_022501 [Punica granatum]|uniref:Uncharacterized protein n=1 Tax=Punica granatum TaxID=22663 RepID=A0A2I0JLJ6_PUNGR|nr:hypothetical protein CRG98_022501 [Punica granatum]
MNKTRHRRDIKLRHRQFEDEINKPRQKGEVADATPRRRQNATYSEVESFKPFALADLRDKRIKPARLKTPFWGRPRQKLGQKRGTTENPEDHRYIKHKNYGGLWSPTPRDTCPPRARVPHRMTGAFSAKQSPQCETGPRQVKDLGLRMTPSSNKHLGHTTIRKP